MRPDIGISRVGEIGPPTNHFVWQSFFIGREVESRAISRVEDVWNLLAVADVAFTEVELTPPLEGEGVVKHVPVHDRTVAIQRSTHVAGGTREDKIRPEAEICELLVS